VGQGRRQLHGRALGVSALTRDAVVLAIALVAVLLIWSTPAHALTERGHSFAGSFGEAFFAEGKKVDPQSGPTAVAVDEAAEGEGAGDVYVLDSAGNRVVRFGPGPEHKFIEAWGYGVKDGSESYEHCTSECQLGIAGHGNGQFESPVAIAVDNATSSPSRGDVYVIANRTSGHVAMDKFSPAGKLLDVLLTGKKEEERAEGAALSIAVDQSGTVWVERQEEFEGFRLERFNDAKANQPIGRTTELEIKGIGGIHPARSGFAVNAEGEAYVTYEQGGKTTVELQEEREAITEREKARKSKHEELKNEKVQQPCTVNHCLVAKLALTGLNYEDEELEASTLISDLDNENSTGVAVELSSGAPWSNNVYVDNATSVAAFTPAGTLIQRFGSEQLKGGGGHGVAVDAETNGVFVADTALGQIDVYKPSEPGPPVVETGSVGAAHVTSSSAELLATIDPGGADTHYRFLYGTSPCAATPSPCSEAPEKPGINLGQAFGDQGAAEKISGLSPSTTYHVLVIVENEFTEEGQAVVSEERTFQTSSSVPAPELPDGRAWELVSSPDKHGASVEPIPIEGGLVQSSADGRSITYVTTGPVGEDEPEGNRASEQSQILGTREVGGWSARDIVTPNESAEGVRIGEPREYLYFSRDFAQALVEPVSAQPLSSQATEQTIYLRHNLTCDATPTSCYEPLVDPADDTGGGRFGGTKEAVKGATPDLSHVVLGSGSGVPLTAEYPRGGLYEWSAGELALISILPKREQANGELTLGGGTLDEMHSTAISENGSRVVFRVGGAGVGHLYMRDTETGETLEIDEPNSDAPTPTLESIPDFKTASADGSKVFFTDDQRLTANSTAPEESPASSSPSDLYVFEANKPAGKRVTDLTPDLIKGEVAAVQGEALASENGSTVYFVANGVLANGAEPGDCAFRATGSAGCNLYVEHYNEETELWEEPSFIARLASEDDPDWGRPEGGTAEAGSYNLKDMTSRVSPDGEYLAFMSSRPLTGYDNVDANSGVSDEEVYLYKYAPGGLGQTKCVSCEPSGARPVGVYDTNNVGEGIGLVVDRPKIWGAHVGGVDHWLAGNIPGWTSVGLKVSFYQSRYLSDSGRLFFNSADALSPKDVNGKEDVYEYEPAGTGSCETEVIEGGCVALISSGESQQESAFLDASENGNDVFFLTNSKLTSDALEASSNVYDARVCGVGGAEPCPSSPPIPPTPCNSEACKPDASSQPTFETPASSTLTGAGNLVGLGEVLSSKVTQKPKPKPLTRKQKLAAALKHCRKLKQKQKRVACEKKARKSYGPKKSSAAHNAAAKSPQQTRG